MRSHGSLHGLAAVAHHVFDPVIADWMISNEEMEDSGAGAVRFNAPSDATARSMMYMDAGDAICAVCIDVLM